MVALRTRMTAHLVRPWREDLEPVWRGFFEGVELDLGGLPDWDVQDLFPDRLDIGHTREAGEAVEGPHMLRAFDGLTPDRVRVVILGQDPYPRRASATGRAFEDGEWDENHPAAVAQSLQRLLQSAAALEHPNLGISQVQADWGQVRSAIHERAITPPAVPGFFNALAAQGVLSVNAAWTFTGRVKRQKDVHLRVWKPVVNHLLRELAERDQPVAFLLLGEDARKTFCGADPVCNHSAVVDSAHPMSHSKFFARSNPFVRVNEALERIGVQDPIIWWPPQHIEVGEPA